MDFVTDRTQADVDARNAKGTYNTTDLNRVISNCNTLVQLLNDAGYPVSISWSRTTWTRTQIPTTDQMQEFLDNVNAIKAALPNNAPNAPASMAYLTYQGATDIEKILQEIDRLLTGLMTIYPRAGAAISGAVIYEVTST